MRTRSAGPLEETPTTSTGKKPVSAKNSRLGKTKIVAAPKPVLRKQAATPIKRYNKLKIEVIIYNEFTKDPLHTYQY